MAITAIAQGDARRVLVSSSPGLPLPVPCHGEGHPGCSGDSSSHRWCPGTWLHQHLPVRRGRMGGPAPGGACRAFLNPLSCQAQPGEGQPKEGPRAPPGAWTEVI